MDDAPQITVLQLPKFKAEAAELIGAGGIEAVAVYLIEHPNTGDVLPGTSEVRKLRWAAKGKGETWRRANHLSVRRDLCPHLPTPLLCEEREDHLTAGEKRELRQIAAHLKGVQ